MAITKITGSQAVLGGAYILTAPTIYAAGSYNLHTTSSTGVFQIYGVPIIEDTTTNAKLGGLRRAGVTEYIAKHPFTHASWTTSVTTNFDTGLDLPAQSIVLDAWFDIHTVGTSNTHGLNAGTDVDPNGFLVGVPSGTAVPVMATLISSGQTYGALLIDQLCTTIGAESKVNYVATSAKNIMVGREATTLTGSVIADLYVKYMTLATS